MFSQDAKNIDALTINDFENLASVGMRMRVAIRRGEAGQCGMGWGRAFNVQSKWDGVVRAHAHSPPVTTRVQLGCSCDLLAISRIAGCHGQRLARPPQTALHCALVQRRDPVLLAAWAAQAAPIHRIGKAPPMHNHALPVRLIIGIAFY